MLPNKTKFGWRYLPFYLRETIDQTRAEVPEIKTLRTKEGEYILQPRSDDNWAEIAIETYAFRKRFIAFAVFPRRYLACPEVIERVVSEIDSTEWMTHAGIVFTL